MAPEHDSDFGNIKNLLQTAPVLRYFDKKKHTAVQCDSSQSGLGACIMQDGAPIFCCIYIKDKISVSILSFSRSRNPKKTKAVTKPQQLTLNLSLIAYMIQT